MKERIFVGPQIPFEDHDFNTKLNATERRTLEAFENICRNFLGNEKVENYSEVMQELVLSYSAVGCNMSLKLHFVHSYLDFFLKIYELSPMNMAQVSIRTFPNRKRGREENGVQVC
jgi:hypothetical protein